MFGPRAILSSIIARVLSTFLEVEPHTIETNLLASDNKRMVLQNVRLKERRIRVSYKDGITRFLVLSGTFEEVVIAWTWSPSLKMIKESLASVKGARMRTHFVFEAEPDLSPINEKDLEQEKPGYLRTLWLDTLSRLKKSEILQQALKDLADTLTIRISDIRFDFVLPPQEAPQEESPNAVPTSLVAGMESFEVCVQGRKNGMLDDFFRRPLNLEITLNSLYLNALDQIGSMPILESFTYTADIRSVFGVRFSTIGSGFEITGRDRRTAEGRPSKDDNRGAVIHVSPKSVSYLIQAVSLFRGQRSVDSVQRSNYLKRQHPAAKVSFHFPKRRFLVIGSSTVLIVSLFWLSFPAFFSTLAWMLGATIFTVGLGMICLYLYLKSNDESKVKPKKKALPLKQKDATIFRLPVPFATVVLPGDRRITLSKLSVLGRLDWTLINFTAASLSACGGSQEKERPRATASGIRFSFRPNLCLLNVDIIEEVFYPGSLRLLKPLQYTVLRFEKGTLTTKIGSMSVGMVSLRPDDDGKSSKDEDDLDEFKIRVKDFVDDTQQKLQEKGRKLNAGIHKRVRTIGEFAGLASHEGPDEIEVTRQEARARIHAELYGQQKKKKLFAQMFERIPLKKNRFRLRVFPHSFRGNEAVDYMLEGRLVDSREEANKILRDLQIQFNLFEHVTRQYYFRDDPDAIFRFVDIRKRRMWDESLLPFKISELQNAEEETQRALPFTMRLSIKELLVRNEHDGEPILGGRGCELEADPAKVAHATEICIFMSAFENKMVSLQGARLRFLIDPQLPRELHGLQFSTDYLHASPGYSSDDWHQRLGFVRQPENSSNRKSKGFSRTSPFALPYMYIAPFKLELSWTGMIFAAKETAIGIESFTGSNDTTSNDLINHFVLHVLGRAPGLVANFRVFGVNIVEKTGVGTAMTVGVRFLPFGQYIAIAGLALYDGVTGALENAKVARDDPHGRYKPGDLIRGIIFSAEEASRTGARKRGKTDEDSYDEEDKVQVDPLDLAVGATTGAAHYVYGNKARFTGATVAGATMVVLTVTVGPVAGIVLGLACGAAAEETIKYTERRWFKKDDKSDSEFDDISII